MAKILILGGGFGGLVAAKRLASSVGPGNDITLVSPNRKFTFYPALVHLAFGECTEDDITFDLGDAVKNMGVRFIHGEMISLNPERRTVDVSGPDLNGELTYDFVIFAMGRRLATEKVPGFFEHAHHLLGAKAASKFGQSVREFNAGKIIVGMCPDGRLPVPVCETAFALAKRFETQMADGTVKVSVIFPDSLEAAFGGATLHNELEAAFKRHRINLLYDVPVNEVSANEVFSSKKHRIECELMMLIPPFRGHSMLREIGITDDSDFIKVDGFMRVHGQDRTYAVGDIVAFSGPKLGHMAVGQAEAAAANIISEIKGEEPTAEYYHEISTIIDAGGADSIFLRYGIWDDSMRTLKKGAFWGWAKDVHDSYWRARNR